MNHALLLFSHSENSLQKLKSYAIPRPVHAGRRCRDYVGFEAGRILKEGGFADSASLSRILAELLGGTRSSPPEAPSRCTDRASDKGFFASVR